MALRKENLLIRIEVENKNASKKLKETSKAVNELSKETMGATAFMEKMQAQNDKMVQQIERSGHSVDKLNKIFSYLNHSIKEFLGVGLANSARLYASELKSLGTKGHSLNLAMTSLNQGFKQTAGYLSNATTQGRLLSGALGKELGGSFLKIIKSSALVSGGLLMFSGAAANSDSKLMKLASTASLIAAVALTGLAVVVKSLFYAVGDLAQGLGIRLFNAMRVMENKARSFQTTMAGFEFTIKGFNRELGSSVGTLEQWQGVLSDLDKKTHFSTNSIASSIKLMVSDASALGVTYKDSSKILGIASDVAASHGHDIIDTTRAIISALNGQGVQLRNLGIDLTDTALNHSDYARKTGKTSQVMSEHEKIMLRLSLLYKKSLPYIGAAAAKMDTVEGATKALNKTLDNLKIKIGEQGIVIRTIITSYQQLLSLFLRLPDSVLRSVGVLADLVSVSLIAGGTLIKMTFTIMALSSVYTVLSSNMLLSAGVTRVLDKAFAALAVRTGATVVATTSLNAAFLNLGRTMKASLAFGVASLGSALRKLPAAITAVTVAILRNPLFYKVTAIVAVFAALAQGARELYAEFKAVFTEIDKSLSPVDNSVKQVSLLGRVWKSLKDSLTGAFNVLKNMAKILLTGISLGFLQAGKAYYAFKIAIYGSKEDERQLERFKRGIAGLADLVNQQLSAVGDSFSSSAIAKTKESLGELFSPHISVSHSDPKKILDSYDSIREKIASVIDANKLHGKSEIDRVMIANKANMTEVTLIESKLKKVNLLTNERRKELEVAKRAYAIQSNNAVNDVMQAYVDKSNDLLTGLQKRKATQLELIDLEKAAALEEIANVEKTLKSYNLLDEKRLESISKYKKAVSLDAAAKAQDVQTQQSGSVGQSLQTIGSMLPRIFGEGASQIGGAISSASASAALGILAAIDAAASAVLAILDFVPNLINKISSIFEKITDLPLKLLSSVVRLFRAIPRFFSNIIPNLGRMVTGILKSAVTMLTTTLPDALVKFADDIPRVIKKVFLILPELVPKLVSGLIRAVPRLIGASLKLLLVELPKMTFDILRSLFRTMLGMGSSLAKSISDGVNRAITAISSKTSDIFNISDLDDRLNISSNIEKLAQRFEGVWDWVKKIWSSMLDKLKEAWNWSVDLLKKAWIWIKEQISSTGSALSTLWQQLLSELKNAGSFVSDLWHRFLPSLKQSGSYVAKIWHGFLGSLSQSGKRVSTLLNGFADNLKIAGKSVADLWHKFLPALKSAGSHVYSLWERVKNGLYRSWDGLSRYGAKIWEGFKKALSSAFDFFKELGKLIWEGFKSVFKLPSIGGSGGWTFPKLPNLPMPKFANGGLVKGNLSGDSVDARLTPGEFVLRREAVSSIGLGSLNMLNKGLFTPPEGKSKQSVININEGAISVRIEAQSLDDVDEYTLREKIFIPLVELLKDASRNGETIAYQSGVAE